MSHLKGKTAAECQVRAKTGTNILAIRRRDGRSVFTNPPAELRFALGDILIALGTREQLKALRLLATT